MKVALVSPLNRAKSARPPIAFMCLAAYLLKNNIDVEIIDIKSSESSALVLEKTIEKLKKISPDIIGLTCLTPDVVEVKIISEAIKKELGNIPIVIGGTHPTLFPKDFLYKNSSIDLVVIGEGEIPFVEICKCSFEKKEYKSIKGVAYFDKEKVILNPPSNVIQDLDSFPFLPYDKIDMPYYTSPSVYRTRGIPISSFCILTTRGCPYRCKFCVEKTNTIGGKVRSMSPKRVVDEIEYLVKNYKIDCLFFYDDTFTMDRNRAIEICNKIMSRKIKILWDCQTRVNLLDEELVKKMAESGCIQIAFGVESGSQRMLDIINKRIKVEDIKKAFDLCKKYNIRQFANFMINLPGETKEDLEMTIALAKELKPTLCVFNVTTPYPGSDLYNEFSEKINLQEEEFSKLANYESYYEFLDFIEKRARIAAYDTPFREILEKLWIEFPGTKDFKPKMNMKYFKSMNRALDFLKNPKYIRKIISSNKKSDYVKWVWNSIKERRVY